MCDTTTWKYLCFLRTPSKRNNKKKNKNLEKVLKYFYKTFLLNEKLLKFASIFLLTVCLRTTCALYCSTFNWIQYLNEPAAGPFPKAKIKWKEKWIGSGNGNGKHETTFIDWQQKKKKKSELFTGLSEVINVQSGGVKAIIKKNKNYIDNDKQ